MNHIGDTNKMVSDTPRTDKAWKTTHSVYEFTVEMKRMERELNAANDRIKRLEEAGDAMEKLLPEGSICDKAVNAWRKAKEAKP